jgi:hypothetical protein
MKRITRENSRIEIPAFMKIFFPYKEKRLFWMPQNRVLYLLLQNKFAIIFINWLFQGIFGMSRIDFFGKIAFEIFSFSILILLKNKITFTNVILSLLIAHTLNWLFNTHFWVLGRFIGITKTQTHGFYQYLEELQKRITVISGLSGVIVIGGASRGGEIRETSDLDIFFIAKPNLLSKFKALAFTIKERMTAVVFKFPLDLYLYENIAEMSKHRKDEVPFVLYDPQNMVKTFYEKQGRKIAYLKDFPRK